MTDFVEETDYTGVRNAELLARIEKHAEWLRGRAAYDLEHIMAPARELAQRAQRAEAERDALRALLDAARAGWRPVTEAPLNVPVYVYVGYSDPFVARRIGENLWQDLDGAEFRFTDHGRFLYRPLPPAPGGEEARP